MVKKSNLVLEMARVGYPEPTVEVYVHTDDPGKIPHFHIRDVATRGNEYHTCVNIKTVEYFHHTGKEDVLTNRQKKKLVDFLNSAPEKVKRFDTNWQMLVAMWNLNNSDVMVDEEQPMPDYMNL